MRPIDRGVKNLRRSTVGDVAQGELAFVSTGCLACHQVGQLGRPSELAQQLLGGGNLTNIAEKRTNVFFRQWLSDQPRVNPDHRMPQFDLTPLEQLDLVSYLSSLADTSPNEQTVEQTAEQILATEGNDGNGETQELVGNVEHGALLITALQLQRLPSAPRITRCKL
ncbi:MAG: c-type cytochrome [Pirellulaceae bacterium]